MGWMWTCFGGKKERLRRVQADGRARQRNKDRSSTHSPPPNFHSLGVQLKSPKEACAYEELFQPKQVVSVTPHGSKLFKRKSVRRAKSCGSSTAFENGAKRLFDKNAEARTIGRIDRLQEEVDGLRKRLAEEEEEAQKLRHEVCYLRSCGVLQSPDRHKNSCNFEKDSSLLRDDKGQRNWQSWLGLTLSPASRFKLEEQLRCMAADEMSKVPGKGLTNGQKALLVATKLWRYQGDPQGDPQQFNQNKTELVNTSCMSDGDGSREDTSGENNFMSEEETVSSYFDNETPFSDYQLTSTSQDPSYRDHLQFEKDLTLRETTGSGSPPSTPRETENFSFRPTVDDVKVNVRHLSPEKLLVKGLPQLQRVPSCPEQMMTGKLSGAPVEKVKLESPRRSCSLPSVGSGSQTSDSDHVQARRFIDMRYQELEEKLLKSPKNERTLENSPPSQSKSHHLDVEQEPLYVSEDVNFSDVRESELSFSIGGIASPSTLNTKPFFACKSGRLWQPLSPVREIDSGRSSGEDLESTGTSQLHVSDSADSSSTSDLKSSVQTIISGCEWEHQEDFPHRFGDINDVHDDDLFTFSPRRLHRSYNPWEEAHRCDDEVEDEHKVDLNGDSGPGTGWASSDEANFDDFVPIQCQSPAFSPKQKFPRNKFAKGKGLKVEDYPRDKYFKEMGFKVDEFLSSSDSCMSTESISSEKENRDGTKLFQVSSVETESPGAGKGNRNGIHILPVPSVTMVDPPNEAAPVSKKKLIVNDIILSQDCDHPILASIENLPKWIECQEISITPVNDKESQHQETLSLEREEIVSTQDGKGKRAISHCSSEASGDSIHQVEGRSLMFQCVEKPGLLMSHQQPKDDVLPFEFSVRQDVQEALHQTGSNMEGCQLERYRLSLHGFVYQDEHLLENRYRSSMENLILKQHHKNDTGFMMDEFSNLGRQGDLDSFLKKLVGNGQAESEKVHNVDGQVRPTLASQGSKREHGYMPLEENTQQQNMVILDSDVGHHVLSHIQSLGYRIQIPKQKEYFLDTELTLESSSVGGDSEVSRDGDETFHDCESPTLSESNPEPAQSNSLLETNPELSDVRTLKSHMVQEEVHSGRKTLDISPDDRPILGTVATHWGESNNPKTHRQWDGLGIPNSTSKFKEDQRVNWQTTSFETRLEQALAKLPIVPEMHHQRSDTVYGKLAGGFLKESP